VIPSIVGLALLAPPQPVAPDRPDVANGTITIAPAAFQLETGLDTEVPPQRFDEAPLSIETALRVGVHERAELRLFEGDVLQWATGSGSGSRRRRRGYPFRPSTLAVEEVPLLDFGGKVRFTDAVVERFVPSIGLQPMIGVRRPGRAFRGHIPVASIALLVSQPLGHRVTLDLNAGVRIDANLSPRRVAAGVLAGSLGVHAQARVLLFAELVGIVADPRDQAVTTDAGVIAMITPRLAFDVAGRATVFARVRSYGVVAGMTALLSDGCWRHAKGRGERRRHPRP